jgi:hypothetical protein
MPFVAILNVKINPGIVYTLGANWFDGAGAVLALQERGHVPVKEMKGIAAMAVRKYKVFFIDNFAIRTLDGVLLLISEYAKPYPTSNIRLGARNVTIESIELHGLRPDEIPQEFRDPRRLMERLKNEESK